MKPYLKIAAVYLVLGCIYIPLSDWVVRTLAMGDPQYLTTLQTAKGWIFVLLSTIIIGYLTKAAWIRKEQDDLERKRLFKKTVEGSCHILLNYLNQMQLVTLEAERSRDFDRRLLSTARRISKETSEELQHLQDLQARDSSDVEAYTYRRLQKAGHGQAQTAVL